MSKVRKLMVFCLAALSMLSASAGQKINWKTKEFSAGRVAIESGFFDFKQILGTANFSPEFRMPIELVYNSGNSKYGLAGRSWTIPQLESKFIPKVNGANWITPWGQKIAFHAKPVHPKDKGKDNLLDCYCIEADYSAADTGAGTWIIKGTKRNTGWSFEYKLGKLVKITAPNGRELTYKYDSRKRLVRVKQNKRSFIRLAYDSELPLATTISINGINSKLGYSVVKTQTLMEATFGNARIGRDPMLASVQKANMAPAKYTYNPDGYLNSVTVGRNIKKFIVDRESVSERRAYLGKIDQMKKGKMAFDAVKRKHIAGRLLKDENFIYSYPEKGVIRLTNKAKQHAEYRFDRKLGILQVKNFAGQTRSYYNFHRYDVAYNGKLRKIVDDDKKLDIVLYEYFPKSGLLKSAKHFNGITMSYEYDEQGNMIKVLRSVKGAKAQAVTSNIYDKNGNRTAVNRLDEKGAVYSAIKLEYDKFNQPSNIGTNYNENNSSYSYNKFGYLTKAQGGFNINTFEYDKYNHLVEAVNADGVKTTYKYKYSGALSRVIVSHEGKELSKQIFRYDRDGQLRSVKDVQGRTVSVKRDNENRIVEKKLPNGASIKYGYDKLGRLSFVEDQNKHKINFVFNEFNKLARRITPSGQVSDWKYDKFGQIASLTDSKDELVGRKAKYTYNKIGQLLKVVYADRSRKRFTYNDLGKTASITVFDSEGKKSETTLKYDFFGRVASKTEIVGDRKTEFTYTYNKAGQRIAMTVKTGQDLIKNTWDYDQFGRLAKITKGNDVVEYTYNDRGRVSKRIANHVETYYTYTPLGQLETKSLGAQFDKSPIASLKYIYAIDGSINARIVNGVKQSYKYDQLGQLTAVLDASGKPVEQYTYDPVGNILNKNVDGKLTTYTYDASNQLVSSTTDGKVTNYEYDAAGRMVKEGAKTYAYNWLNKVMNITENGKVTNSYSYSVDGQLASANEQGKQESFIWDGLALIKRGTTEYVYEPAVTGGNPILANGKGLFNDMLGNSLGVAEKDKFTSIKRDAFGKTLENSAGSQYNMFTGKPQIGGLGYAFLFRNYRPNLGKWQTSDPIGYPDGLNSFAYMNNVPNTNIDRYGLCRTVVISCSEAGCTSNYCVQTHTKVVHDVASSQIVTSSTTSFTQVGDAVRNTCGSGANSLGATSASISWSGSITWGAVTFSLSYSGTSTSTSLSTSAYTCDLDEGETHTEYGYEDWRAAWAMVKYVKEFTYTCGVKENVAGNYVTWTAQRTGVSGTCE